MTPRLHGSAKPQREDPQESRPVDRRARTRLLLADDPWGSSAPKNSHSRPDPRRESPVLRPESRLGSHHGNGRLRAPTTHGAPSRSVNPSGGNSSPDFPVQPRRPLGAKRNLEPGQITVKAAFPLVKRVCPARKG
jgi:hypothetical protein